MVRTINRGDVFGSIMAYTRERHPFGRWVHSSELARALKVSVTYARYAMQMIGDNEQDFEYHKGEIRYVGPRLQEG